eukprot:CAMPEP_0184330554 /NCGR_PEP_ID=MMETSP1049-20130417/144746_1 /TAXON_ID=77928 /ORGANISM="Proteomonas sulcata, Strain CCMP704" /LENGTH=251 /DNA_ID=CAMNT_0026652999 /DNA_START=526 /DNA_END=1283 /DNA_ORIENTATION=-
MSCRPGRPDQLAVPWFQHSMGHQVPDIPGGGLSGERRSCKFAARPDSEHIWGGKCAPLDCSPSEEEDRRVFGQGSGPAEDVESDPSIGLAPSELEHFETLLFNDDVSLEELASNPVFCAGFQEPLESRQDIWDLYVDVSAQEITVSENAKKDFVMTSVHKDVAKAMQAFIEEESDDLQIIEGIAAKTKELLGKLELLAGDGGLSLQSLQEQLSNVSLASFLFNVALAEGLASTTGEEEGEDENADSEEPEE